MRIARQRAFCPFSQIDTMRTEPAAHIGRVYEFRITEYGEGGRNIIVSRRALLEETQRAGAADVRRSIVAGAVMTGRVTSVREFGAFVDLGGGVQVKVLRELLGDRAAAAYEAAARPVRFDRFLELLEIDPFVLPERIIFGDELCRGGRGAGV